MNNKRRNNSSTHNASGREEYDGLYQIAHDLVSALRHALTIIGAIVVVFIVAYLISTIEIVTSSEDDTRWHFRGSQDILKLLGDTIRSIFPVLISIIKIIVPIIILSFIISFVLSRRFQSLDSDKIKKFMPDLTGFLALIIVITICILPISDIPIPPILNNIALVVVGFYFGKRGEKL